MDSGGLSFEKEFTIKAKGINEPPTEISLSTTEFKEDIPVGSMVTKLSTKDPDTDDTFLFADQR